MSLEMEMVSMADQSRAQKYFDSELKVGNKSKRKSMDNTARRQDNERREVNALLQAKKAKISERSAGNAAGGGGIRLPGCRLRW